MRPVLLCATLALLLGGLVLPPARSEEGCQVIVNVANAAAELDRSEVARFFLRQSVKWNDGRVVQPVDQSTRSAVRDAFSRTVLKQPLPAVESYWQRQIVAGRITPPPVKVSDAEVLAFVAANPAAIGYISPGLNLTPGVKAVKLKE
jgi:ABC-type phosphate transport system substrate-binding protein